MNNNKILPKISVITPSFNQGQFIENTIQSVLNQNYPNLEYILIDGGSTDNSLEIIKKYEKNISYWVSEPDNGQTHALNKGVSKATGEIFSFLNSDDIYLAGTLNKVGEFFSSNPSAYVLCGGFREVDKNGDFIRERDILPNITWEDIVLCRTYQPQAPTFWRRSAFDIIGNFEENLHYYFDQEFFIRLLKNYKLFCMSGSFTIARIHDQAKSWDNASELANEKHNVTLKYLSEVDGKFLEKLYVYRMIKLIYYREKILSEESTLSKKIKYFLKEPVLFTSLNFICNILFSTNKN